MNHLLENDVRRGERGSASAKLLLVAVVLILVANAGYNYIPTAYQGENFKQEMKAAVMRGIALPPSHGKTVDVVKKKLRSTMATHQIPIDAYMDVKQKNNVVSARVYYQKKVPILPFGIYEYDYIFDHTITPNGFLTE